MLKIEQIANDTDDDMNCWWPSLLKGEAGAMREAERASWKCPSSQASWERSENSNISLLSHISSENIFHILVSILGRGVLLIILFESLRQNFKNTHGSLLSEGKVEQVWNMLIQQCQFYVNTQKINCRKFLSSTWNTFWWCLYVPPELNKTTLMGPFE